MHLTGDDLEAIRDILREELRDGLVSTGIDADHPLESQADFRFLRAWRKTASSGLTKGVIGAVALIITAVVSAALAGIGLKP